MDIIRKIDASYIAETNGLIQPNGFGVFLCTGGECRLGVDGMTYDMAQDSLFVFKPFSVINLEHASADVRGVMMIVDVEKTMLILNDVSPDMRLSVSAHPCVSINEKQAAMICRLLDFIHDKEELRGSEALVSLEFYRKATECLVRSVCYEVFGIYSTGRFVEGRAVKRDNQIFTRFIASVHANCHCNRTVSYYAGLQNISAGHFASAVRSVSGHGPAHWINLIAMSKIRQLLLETGLSHKEIGQMMGFQDQSSFGRYFRQHEGVSPAAYRAKMKG